MDASLQFNIPAYASAVVSTDEIVAQLSVARLGDRQMHEVIDPQQILDISS
jgi:hypothetical protein